MIKNLISMEIVKDCREYRFILTSDSPLGECYDVLTEMRAEILKIINENSQGVTKPQEELHE